MDKVPHWIGGKRVDGRSERRVSVFNPATGRQTAQVELASEAEVDCAVEAANSAFCSWRDTALTSRQRVLFSLRELVIEHIEELATLVSSEHGKTIDDARGEVQRGIEVLEFACGIPHLLKGEYSMNVSRGVDTHMVRESLGVTAGITPFNFPAMVPLWMFPMAIACGNTFVLKPSERDPSTSLRLAELCRQAGVPDGVLNVLHGDGLAAERLLSHPDVAAISFVGSTRVAKAVYAAAATNGKRVQALGGAKNHMVVLPDADMDLAADAAVSAGYGSAGERCMAISVVVTVGEAGDNLVGKLAERVSSLRVGPGTVPSVDMGPLITAEHRDRVAKYVEQGLDEGAALVHDGRGVVVEGYEQGFFLGPTLLDWVTTDMAVYQDEIFGPVLSVVRTDSLDEAIALINANPYGNGTAVFTNHGGVARRFQERITVGMVGINIPIPVPLAFYSFGGWKASLFGDRAIYGPESVGFYTRPKTVVSRWPRPRSEESSQLRMAFPSNS